MVAEDGFEELATLRGDVAALQSAVSDIVARVESSSESMLELLRGEVQLIVREAVATLPCDVFQAVVPEWRDEFAALCRRQDEQDDNFRHALAEVRGDLGVLGAAHAADLASDVPMSELWREISSWQELRHEQSTQAPCSKPALKGEDQLVPMRREVASLQEQFTKLHEQWKGTQHDVRFIKAEQLPSILAELLTRTTDLGKRIDEVERSRQLPSPRGAGAAVQARTPARPPSAAPGPKVPPLSSPESLHRLPKEPLSTAECPGQPEVASPGREGTAMATSHSLSQSIEELLSTAKTTLGIPQDKAPAGSPRNSSATPSLSPRRGLRSPTPSKQHASRRGSASELSRAVASKDFAETFLKRRSNSLQRSPKRPPRPPQSGQCTSSPVITPRSLHSPGAPGASHTSLGPQEASAQWTGSRSPRSCSPLGAGAAKTLPQAEAAAAAQWSRSASEAKDSLLVRSGLAPSAAGSLTSAMSERFHFSHSAHAKSCRT